MPPKARRGGAGGRRPRKPFPWDPHLPANKKNIQTNYDQLLVQVVNSGCAGLRPTEVSVRDWHVASVRGVWLAEKEIAGGFRGEGPAGSELSTYLNGVNGIPGAPPAMVSGRVTTFFAELNVRLDGLDARLTAGETVPSLYPDIVRTAAWAHGEWVRIHPFADHNGSTARLMAITIGLLYGVHFKLPGKPRSAMPNPGLVLDYDQAAGDQMLGNDQNMVVVLHKLAQ
ncbi:Fic family protein [Nocardioides sp. SOB77]|uniref:Fic family protein n=1 Tax=Nocardioides oceani TaxID=3058369 RepID=A0ABT8FDC8_9ACTN|nr:Fic family protein [Nocardioides oceani]MDN4172604.1 Fic family protein [Nocardioides oceani]